MFIDCGDNYGRYTIDIAATLTNCQVIAIEFSEINLHKLKSNIDLNQLQKKITVIDKALTRHPNQTITTYCPENKSYQHRLSEYMDDTLTEKPTLNMGTTSSTSLDILYINHIKNQSIKKIVIKLDIEGAEIDALLGGHQLIKELQPCMIIEFSRMNIGTPNKVKKLEDWIKQHDYKILDLHYKKVEIIHVYHEVLALPETHEMIGNYILAPSQYYHTSWA